MSRVRFPDGSPDLIKVEHLILSARLFFFITEFVKADALFAVLVVEQHDDFIIINMNAIYENIDQPYRKNKRPAVWTGNDGANKEI